MRALVFLCAVVLGLVALASCTESGTVEPRGGGASAIASFVCTPPASERARDVACSRWACAHAQLAAARWDGDPKTCAPGTIDARAKDRALALVNVYRWLAGVEEVDPEEHWEAPAQDCALLAHANRRLSHTPPRSWSCWSERAARASAVSLVANRSAPLAIDAFIEDPGNEPSMVHRRWLLTEKIRRIGLGSTSGFACAVVDGREWDAREPRSDKRRSSASWVAWPPSGPVPIDAFRRTSVDTIGWTVQSSSLDLAGARVEVRAGGAPLPVTVHPLERDLGSLTAIRFVPDGWASEAGKRYDVHVAKDDVEIDYAVTPVACE